MKESSKFERLVNLVSLPTNELPEVTTAIQEPVKTKKRSNSQRLQALFLSQNFKLIDFILGMACFFLVNLRMHAFKLLLESSEEENWISSFKLSEWSFWFEVSNHSSYRLL